MRRSAFADCHPVINITFFTGAFVFGMLSFHPLFLGCSLLLSSICYLTVKGFKSWKFLLGMLPLFVVLTLINPLFNAYGETVLFTYFSGRPYTLEALFYGMALAAMFVSVLVWFASYNEVMTSDKFLYLFGRFAPSVTLILTMVLRLVPQYQKKLTQIGSARKCIGKSGKNQTKKEQIKNGTTQISALTSWALEGGVVMADSMRSRGYGCGKRTNFSIYRFEAKDKVLLIVMCILIGITFVSILHGGAYVTYTPAVEMADWNDPFLIPGICSYFIFLAIPAAINLWEEITWHYLKSKI